MDTTRALESNNIKNRTDEDIKISVVAGLVFDARVDAAEVQVTVEDGRVRLSGTVPTGFQQTP